MESNPNDEIKTIIGQVKQLTRRMPNIASDLDIESLLRLSRVVTPLGKKVYDLKVAVAWLLTEYVEETWPKGTVQEPRLN